MIVRLILYARGIAYQEQGGMVTSQRMTLQTNGGPTDRTYPTGPKIW